MKGIVFTEFMELVEKNWGLDMVDDIVDATALPSGGAYTSVGTYDIQELLDLVTELSRRVETPVPTLVHAFGNYLASSFAGKFPDFFAEVDNSFDFLKRVDNHIHVEVRKLYADAELPVFSYQDVDENTMILNYQSTRHLPDLAHGLIEGTAKYYNEELDIQRSGESVDGECHERFQLTRH